SRYQENRSDEIGRLGRSFNKMLDQIQRFISLVEWKERQRWEAELRSLQEHIKPHFLYNTLDTIHWMARKRGADDVAQVIESLSKLFRIGLSKGKDMILFSEEIEHIQSYLSIQKVRYQEKLNYTIAISPCVHDLYIVKLILQPIVENAIYHGIKQRRGSGHITIRAEEKEGRVIIKVQDDGVGMSKEALASLRRILAADFIAREEKINGYGMMNVQARIQLAFGSSYGLDVESEEGKGTTVTIVHPIIRTLGGKKCADMEGINCR
ncbi:sensor histidine kinase, partial [uncultured Anoxybacillus sp.]|uniref:sensor histidine kinase n=1 Tax=uncultured Anoxybacillus sp. TaxID=263860 RepID=UPI0026126767